MGLFRRFSLSSKRKAFLERQTVCATLSEGCKPALEMATKEKKGGFFSMLKGHSKSKEAAESKKSAHDDSKDSLNDSKTVKRRDSAKLASAAKLLRSLRLDRTSPAYHSEGKGLRKRKQAWTSERDLPQGDFRKKTAERSRSFSERPKFESVQDLTTLSHDSTVSDMVDSSCADDSQLSAVLSESLVVEEKKNEVFEENFEDSKKNDKKRRENDVKRDRQERKLTKDSGYETSCSDYANTETLKSISEVDNSTESIYANLQEIQEGGYSARETDFFGCEEESLKPSPQNFRKIVDSLTVPENNPVFPDSAPKEVEVIEDNDGKELCGKTHDESDEAYCPAQRTETPLATGMTGSKSTPNLDSKCRGSDPLSRASWDWSNTDEEYASQLRSALLGHNRQPSSLSSSSSHSRQISSVSDEGILSSCDQRSRPLSESLSHLSASSGGDRYFSFDHLDDVGLPQQWDPMPISPLHRSPPPPPVRDMSSLKYARSQSQTHEKYPSWPMPQRPDGDQTQQSQRSKSWTEHTEYPKEPVPVYTRAYGRRPLPGFNQQLKPVIENLSHELYESQSPIPSPDPPSTMSRYTDPDYVRYDDLRSYSQSEGYSSYVSSEASYVSNSSSTPLLDRLRLESEVVRPEIVRNSPSSVNGRDSVTTIVTNSSSGSSNDTQKIHGSYSDLSVYSLNSRQGVAHSARVQLPQRHNSESVLFYTQDQRRLEEKRKYPVHTYEVTSDKEFTPRSPAIDTTKLAPVSERIFQLERQSKSVPNLIDKSPSKPVKSPSKEILTYLDPEKRLQVAEPTLKQIQKQALMNYYERKVSSKVRSDYRKQSFYDSNSQNPEVFMKDEHDRKLNMENRLTQENYVNYPYQMRTSQDSLPMLSSVFPEIDPIPDAVFPVAEATTKVVLPPERPPKKPHMRANAPPIPQGQRAGPQQPISSRSSVSSLSPTRIDSRPILKKPPAPEPPLRPDVESRVPPYHGRWNEDPNPRKNDHRPARLSPEDLDRPQFHAPPPYKPNDSPPALPLRISPTFPEPISGSYLKAPAFKEPPPVLPSRLSPTGLDSRSITPELPPPPPPVVSPENGVQDAPLPPPPSPILSKEKNRSSYTETELVRDITSKMADFYHLETSTTPSGWEKHHNIRSNGTTVIFTSEELAKIKEKQQKMHQKSSVENIYRSEIIIYPAADPVKVEFAPSNNHTLPRDDLVFVSTLPRQKLPEELECEKLSVELVQHLPASDRLRAILGGPELKTTSDYVEKIFGAPEIGLLENGCDSPPPSETKKVTAPSSPNRSPSTPVLPASSAYFTTSESKAKLLNQYSGDIEKQNKETLEPSVLLQKKEDLVNRLDRKLEILRLERQAVQEDILANEDLGKVVSSRVATVATPGERNKVALHIVEVEKITALLLGLAGRLARAQNALAYLPEDTDMQERVTLVSKRDKLDEQLDEARALKDSIDKRSRTVSIVVQKYFSDDEFADYEHFITMKAKLAIDAREIEEKIKLGEEQLTALKETLNIS